MPGTEESSKVGIRRPLGLGRRDQLLLYVTLVLWTMFFVAGTLINSAPYREQVASLEIESFVTFISSFTVVIATYTLTNVALLCILAGLLGTLGRRSQLGSDSDQDVERDTVNPRSSAVLRGFLVYLALIAGILILGDDPASPTQRQYVRLAGFMSLLSFIVNARPSMFGRFLHRLADVVDSRSQENHTRTDSGTLDATGSSTDGSP